MNVHKIYDLHRNLVIGLHIVCNINTKHLLYTNALWAWSLLDTFVRYIVFERAQARDVPRLRDNRSLASWWTVGASPRGSGLRMCRDRSENKGSASGRTSITATQYGGHMSPQGPGVARWRHWNQFWRRHDIETWCDSRRSDLAIVAWPDCAETWPSRFCFFHAGNEGWGFYCVCLPRVGIAHYCYISLFIVCECNHHCIQIAYSLCALNIFVCHEQKQVNHRVKRYWR